MDRRPRVEVWFEGGGQRVTRSLPGRIRGEAGRVLVVAAEDYTSASPVQDRQARTSSLSTPTHLPPTVRTRTYDIDAAGRVAPDALEVLSHYDAVVWEDRRPGHPHRRPRWRQRRPAGTRRTARVPLVHERGRQGAPRRRLRRSAVHHGAAVRPQGRDRLQPASRGYGPRRCLPLFGSFFGGDTANDVLQYWLGGYVAVANDGHVDGAAFDSMGVDDPFTRPRVGSRRPIFAGNTIRRSSFLATSGILPVDQVRSSRAGRQRGTTSRAARSTRTPEPSTSTRRSPTSRTEAHPRDRRAGSWRVDDVLDVVRHRGRVGPPVRGGPYSRR